MYVPHVYFPTHILPHPFNHNWPPSTIFKLWFGGLYWKCVCTVQQLGSAIPARVWINWCVCECRCYGTSELPLLHIRELISSTEWQSILMAEQLESWTVLLWCCYGSMLLGIQLLVLCPNHQVQHCTQQGLPHHILLLWAKAGYGVVKLRSKHECIPYWLVGNFARETILFNIGNVSNENSHPSIVFWA